MRASGAPPFHDCVAMPRGAEGTALENEAIVIRMWYQTAMTNAPGLGSGALAAAFGDAFKLGSEDKKEQPPHLSVYDESLTTHAQAKSLTGKDVALRLPVTDVRTLANPACADNRLDVLWCTGMVRRNGELVPDCREGADGHCGITGLKRPDKFPRKDWKWFRVKLADIAVSNGPVIVS